MICILIFDSILAAESIDLQLKDIDPHVRRVRRSALDWTECQEGGAAV